MLVKDRMTPNPICGHPEMSVTEAQELMQEKKFRHLPIIDADGNLMGLVTQRTLLRALPSDLRGFSRFEISYVLAKIKARDVMTKDVITIDGDVAVEEAARIMADNKIGCLPVCDGDRLSGIITDNDLFAIMVDLMGGRRSGIRITILQQDKAGEMARLTSAIAKENGSLSVIVGCPGPEPGTWLTVCKVVNFSREKIEKSIGMLDGVEVLDIRDTD